MTEANEGNEESIVFVLFDLLCKNFHSSLRPLREPLRPLRLKSLPQVSKNHFFRANRATNGLVKKNHADEIVTAAFFQKKLFIKTPQWNQGFHSFPKN
ncbi:MAG: hypothetical protein ABIR24_02710 [Verrucomicrobiota bacterium]